MYTIRQILGQTLGLTKSGVKMQFAGLANQPNAGTQALDALTKAKDLLKKIREASIFKGEELKQLTELLKTAGKSEDDRNKALKTELTTELAKPTRTQAEWDARDYTNPTQ